MEKLALGKLLHRYIFQVLLHSLFYSNNTNQGNSDNDASLPLTMRSVSCVPQCMGKSDSLNDGSQHTYNHNQFQFNEYQSVQLLISIIVKNIVTFF